MSNGEEGEGSRDPADIFGELPEVTEKSPVGDRPLTADTSQPNRALIRTAGAVSGVVGVQGHPKGRLITPTAGHGSRRKTESRPKSGPTSPRLVRLGKKIKKG